MPRPTIAYTKNIIRRAFREIIDESLSISEKDAVWKYFKGDCAYCGTKLQRDKREAHLDHLVSASQNGPNHISNRVLSCANCNEKGKRDLNWEKFLENKIMDPLLLKTRKEQILIWQERHSRGLSGHAQNLAQMADALSNDVIRFFELKIDDLKIAKKAASKH